MSVKKEDLGRGIRALLDDIDEELNKSAASVVDTGATQREFNSMHIPLDAIEVNPFQPRTDFEKEKLDELTSSIKVHGLITPITVRSLGGKKYQLIAGERRLRAAKLAGLKEIPAYIRSAGDQGMLEMGLIENIQREDLNAMEIGISMKRLLEECDLTQEELGLRLGKKRSTVTNYLRLLKLPPDIQKALKDKRLTMGHARAIINIDDPVEQLRIFKEIVANDLSVRKAEGMARNVSVREPKSEASKKSLPVAYQKIQDELSSLLSTKVKIKKYKGEHGEITISFYSDDDLERIIDAFG